MIHPAETDIIELVKQVVHLLTPFAKTHGISLSFEAKERKLISTFRPDLVISELTNLVCQVISYTPEKNAIVVLVDKINNDKAAFLQVSVTNTGINLSLVKEITLSCSQVLEVKGDKEKKQTCFMFAVAITGEEQNKQASISLLNKKSIPPYYDEIRKRLRSHFSKADNLVAQLSILYPKEAAFLQKLNAVITTNVENELFDTEELSRAMNMSRTQLFRRLKPLIRQAPAAYIKSIRLQRAKELLETTDITVSEAAFKTGFQTLSHFTKVFTETFGFLPSSIKRKDHAATNE